MKKKKNILISAGGTATAWHLSYLIHHNFSRYYNLVVCDINPKHLVPSSIFAKQFFQVPPIDANEYREFMLDLFMKNKIDLFVPLLDHDVYTFPTDDGDLLKLGVSSTGVKKQTIQIMSNKKTWSEWLLQHQLPVPHLFNSHELNHAKPDHTFFIKPILGFGSRGVKVVNKKDAMEHTDKPYIIQEICKKPEVTIEVFQNEGLIRTLCRERVETKEGVCTKAKIWFDQELHSLAQKICKIIELPHAFCFQVMKNKENEWVVIDINPRLGAGTSMSTCYGWSLASAALCKWGIPSLDPLTYLNHKTGVHYVVRVYQDIVMDSNDNGCNENEQ